MAGYFHPCRYPGALTVTRSYLFTNIMVATSWSCWSDRHLRARQCFRRLLTTLRYWRVSLFTYFYYINVVLCSSIANLRIYGLNQIWGHVLKWSNRLLLTILVRDVLWHVFRAPFIRNTLKSIMPIRYSHLPISCSRLRCSACANSRSFLPLNMCLMKYYLVKSTR